MRCLPHLALLVLAPALAAQTSVAKPPVLHVDWNDAPATTRTTITLQVVGMPPLRQASPIHDAAWKNLAALHADNVRLALWYPYPRLAVAELAPGQWDFTSMDPVVDDFLQAISGHSNVFTLSTMPTWLFRDADPGPVPASPNDAMWNYEVGTALRDPTGQQAADYYARVASWYTAGGFTDESGVRHDSDHHDKIAWWEVLNEPEYEHGLNIETYTRLYDRIVAAVHAVTPSTRFVGMSLAEPTKSPQAFTYFLDPAHHTSGTPLDAISFHFYADAASGETIATEQYSFFDQADAFLNAVRYIDAIRQRLSPKTEIMVNEAGCIASSDIASGPQKMLATPPQAYEDLCGAVFAYLYAGLAEQGISLLGASQLLGFPTQYPSVSLLDWKTGAPNARYRVLQLLHQELGPGDRIAHARLSSPVIFAAAYIAPDSARMVLLVNKHGQPASLYLPGRFTEQHVSGNSISAPRTVSGTLTLPGFAVMLLHASD